MDDRLAALLERARAWPPTAQDELADLAEEIEAELAEGVYTATPEELRGIDRGLRDDERDDLVSDGEIEAVFAKHRPK
jgi:hypothetical protein